MKAFLHVAPATISISTLALAIAMVLMLVVTPSHAGAGRRGSPTRRADSRDERRSDWGFANDDGHTHLSPSEERAIVQRARLEIERVSVYDAAWAQTSQYPMGDIPQTRGACTDVVVRSLREIGLDLQELVHEDIHRDPRAYRLWQVDPNIDHRRISTMFTFFQRNTRAVTTDLNDKSAWRAGDIVFIAWQRTRGAPPEHVGVISDRLGPRGLPLVLENVGPKAVEQDSLGRRKIAGHFRALKKR